MKTFRRERIESLILEELNKLIIKELEFSGALVTITGVEVSEDSENALVKFSTLPTEKSDMVFKIFKKFVGRLQFLLLKKINIKLIIYGKKTNCSCTKP